jgi:alpha-galactosidase
MERRHAYLRAAGTSLLLDLSSSPQVVHWGADLGALDDRGVEQIRTALTSPALHSDLDHPAAEGLMRENARGFLGHPTLSGHRAGAAFSPLFTLVHSEVQHASAHLRLHDESAGLQMDVTIAISAAGVITVDQRLTNIGQDPYTVNSIVTWLPLREEAAEVLDFTGR